MESARAAIAGALIMLLGIWIMLNDQSEWKTHDVVFAVLALLTVALLLVGIDIRPWRIRRRDNEYHPDDDRKDD